MSEQNRSNLHRLYDISAYIRAARAVACAVTEATPVSREAFPLNRANQLADLSEAVQFLLNRAYEMANDLEAAMEGEE